MKVAIFGQLLPGSAGGIETNLLKLTKALGAGNSSEDSQIIIGPGGETDWLLPHLGFGQSALPWPPFRYELPLSSPKSSLSHVKRIVKAFLNRSPLPSNYDSARELDSKLRREGVRVVHFPYQRYFRTSLPFIFEPWDLQHIHLPELFTPAEIKFRDFYYRQACNDAALIVSATQWTKKDLIENFGIQPQKIAVINRGYDDNFDKNDMALSGEFINKHGIPAEYILYPAKTWPHKNHIRLFHALANLRDKGIIMPLVCTGKPVEATQSAIAAELQLLKLDKQILFTGYLSDSMLQQLYMNAKFVIFPSLFEGLGIPVLEAMAFGTPVVCSRATCLPEISGNSAVFFDPYSIDDIANKIAEVSSDASLRIRMKNDGYSNVRKYSWDETARKIRIVYDYLAGGNLSNDQANELRYMLS